MDIGTYEWLGQWEAPVYFGKHDRYEPALVCNGYLYRYDRNGNLYGVPWTAVSGKREKTWSRSPQVRFWMDEPRKSISKRVTGWLKAVFRR